MKRKTFYPTIQRSPSQFQQARGAMNDMMKQSPLSKWEQLDIAAADIEWKKYLDEIAVENGLLKEEPRRSWFAELWINLKIGKR